MQILAATDFSPRSTKALRQAGLLARASDANLAVIYVVDENQPEALVEMEKREAERVLTEQVGAMAELCGVECRLILVSGAPFSGILQAAASMQADLVVMGPHRRRILLDVFVGTTVERVIRTGRFPVLMVSNEAQRPYEHVIAAVDLSDPSANALRIARTVGLLVEQRTTVLHAFLSLAKGKMFVTDAGKNSINQHVESERHRARNDLTEFLSVNGLERQEWSLRVEEGRPFEVITQTTREVRPDLLVMGTHGRSGILNALIGSVTQEALRSLNVDILVVPPPGP